MTPSPRPDPIQQKRARPRPQTRANGIQWRLSLRDTRQPASSVIDDPFSSTRRGAISAPGVHVDPTGRVILLARIRRYSRSQCARGLIAGRAGCATPRFMRSPTDELHHNAAGHRIFQFVRFTRDHKSRFVSAMNRSSKFIIIVPSHKIKLSSPHHNSWSRSRPTAFSPTPMTVPIVRWSFRSVSHPLITNLATFIPINELVSMVEMNPSIPLVYHSRPV